MSTLRNVARNALRPHYLPVMARKVAARLKPSHRDEAVEWAGAHVESLAGFAAALDPDLWAEAQAWAADFRVVAQARLDEHAVPLRGGGHYQLVHFLVRYRRPRVVLETGVAAGYTSQAILAAMDKNGEGTLYSSDFPYFRLDAPERYVGCLVDDAYKPHWHLGLNGDRANLAEFLPDIDTIDLVHYDSDKSVEGRAFVMEAIRTRLSPEAVLVMDDIDDNTFFRDWVQQSGTEFRVFGGGRKFVGLTGL
ncbi:MAG TPA: class I SAM-dependent methyltransferase [Acidimicrobiia bacterium]|jgi:predicted O-methyltransferase YrrM